jgi:hypothetical protein
LPTNLFGASSKSPPQLFEDGTAAFFPSLDSVCLAFSVGLPRGFKGPKP